MTEPENPVISRIINNEIVRKHFGYWPAFHDAEITKVTFESHPGYWPSATFTIAAFEMTAEVDEKGYHKRTKQCDIELQFTGIREMDFDGFSHQNVILRLEFEVNENDIESTFDASVGLNALIVAEEVLVLSLTPTKQ